MSPSNAYTSARAEIFEAHNLDPTTHTLPDGSTKPYETHYAEQMEHYLNLRQPNTSEILRLAIAAQHFRRWEVPRSTYPEGKAGYLNWRRDLKKRQAEQVGEIVGKYYSKEERARCEGLVRKEGLKYGGDQEEEEVQVLEDVACLVFLSDQFERFEGKLADEEKMVGILRKTWKKMSERGREMALGIEMSAECRRLVERALEG